ncbi:MAG: leucine-rich repeat protein [Treponema sp.]|nr:leucine-rich repeat protein [Treponema sp.]
MKSMYIEKGNKKNIAYFIGSFKDNNFVEIDNTATISESAFAHSDVEKILFKNCSPNIGEKAFEGCESLVTVIFGELEKDKQDNDKSETTNNQTTNNQTTNNQTTTENYETKIGKNTIKNLKLASTSSAYAIQANAFKDCAKLATLVLPQVSGTLTIEKDAFSGCGALRTVVAICNKVDFTDNPFADSPEHLTFICKENSNVARFARENGYRSVYVG